MNAKLARRALFLTCMSLAALSSHGEAHAEQVPLAMVKPAKAPPKVQIAILLDTSGSMDGLIRQAKSELWSIVNRFSEARQGGVAPIIEVALYEYGKDSISADEGHLRMITALTSDLDAVSEELFALRTNGGSEYAGLVIDRSVHGLQWSNSSSDYRAIFIAGNEPFTQGPMPYETAISKAGGKGIIVNTIHCGGIDEGIQGKWKHAAKIGEGEFLTIEQDHQVQEIATPFDKEIAALSGKLNTTYIAYGREGHKKAERQMAQDANASSMGVSSMAKRAKTKGGGAYKNSSWDLVDSMNEDAEALDSIQTTALPKVMQSMSKKERKQYVAKKAAERNALQAKIHALSAKREKYIQAERKKMAKEDKTSTLDKAMLGTVNKQMKRKGFKFQN